MVARAPAGYRRRDHWPQCIAGAPDLDYALAAFAVHCFNDPAWLALGEDELRFRIELLGAAAEMRLANG